MSFVVFKQKDKNFLYVFTNPPTFLIRKVGKRISRRLRHFILAKFLRFQGTFFKKSLGQGLGLTAPTDNTHKKARCHRAFNYRNVLELRSTPCFKRLFVKSPLKIRKNLAPITPPYFYKVFEVPRDFFQKVPWSGSHGNAQAGNHGTIIKSVPATIITSPNSDFFVRRSLKTK